ncbi:MAG: VOC family protein [Ginsengibacter sp.]
MENNLHPTYGHGKICYLEIPANDIIVSSDFYKKVFGWDIRDDQAGKVSFDDGVGEVSGTWVVGPKPSNGTGIIISIMVNDIQESMDLIIAHGGIVLQRPVYSATEKYARFTDPFGNIFGLYQHFNLDVQ